MWRALTLSLAILVAGCSNLQLVSRYDDETDRGAAKLQRDLAGFFVGIDADPRGPDATFAANQGFYKKAAVDIAALQARAGGLYRNSLTVEQLALVRDNLAWLALLHKGCVSGALQEPQREAVRENGIDASLDCRTDHGASADLPDRGDQRLNPALVSVVRRLLDQQLGAVMALEMAKRRGEK